MKRIPDLEHQRIGRGDFIEGTQLYQPEAIKSIVCNSRKHFSHTLSRRAVKRLTKIWKRRISSNFCLDVNGQSFGQKAVGIWEKNMS